MHSLTKNILFYMVLSSVFLNLVTYVGSVQLISFPSYMIDLSFFILFLFIYKKYAHEFPWGNKIFLWLLYYVSLHIIYFLTSDAGTVEFNLLKLIIFFTFFIIYISMFFNLDDKYLSSVSKVMILLGIVASISLVIDYIIPGYFFELAGQQVNDAYEMGRSASMYMNSNIAGGAMIIFLIFTIDAVPKSWRIPYILILFIGLFTTMSRSNIMIFLLVITIMFFQKKLYARQAGTLLLSIALFFGWLASGGLDTIGNQFDIEISENMKSRVNFFADNKSSDTSDMDERKVILDAAIEMFTDKPLFGHGLGSTRLWEYRVSPHNTFVMHWADFGFFGLLIIPLLLFLSTIDIIRYGNKQQKDIALLSVIFFIVSSFFSHNMLEQQLNVAAIVILSMMGYKSRKDYMNIHP